MGMNRFEMTELSRLLNQALYEEEEFGRTVTENLWSEIYKRMKEAALIVAGNSEIEGRDDAMRRFMLAQCILCCLAAKISDPDLSEKIQDCANTVYELKLEYGRLVYD